MWCCWNSTNYENVLHGISPIYSNIEFLCGVCFCRLWSPVAHSMDELVPRKVKMAACRRSTSCLLYFIDIELAKLRGTTVLLSCFCHCDTVCIDRNRIFIIIYVRSIECGNDEVMTHRGPDQNPERKKNMAKGCGERNKKENATQMNWMHTAQRWRHTCCKHLMPNLVFAHKTEWRQCRHRNC